MPAAIGAKAKIGSAGVQIEVERRGSGPPLLLLYGEEARELESAVIDELAKEYEVIIPSPPGFGASDRPDWITNPDDIAYIYLDLIEALGLLDVVVLGFSFGGWLAAEIATKNCSFIKKLVLVGAYGLKYGGPTDRNIQDIWLLPPNEVMRLKWTKPELGVQNYASMSEQAVTILARNNESFARFGWNPYLHNPKLKERLHRIRAPSLLIWGQQDGIVTTEYAHVFRSLIPGAEIALVPEAGHLPHIEQPRKFLDELQSFLSR